MFARNEDLMTGVMTYRDGRSTRPARSLQRKGSVQKRRNFFQLDLLTEERRELWERAAARNGLTLSEWIRRVCDAEAEHRPLELPADVPRLVSDDPVCTHRVFRVEVLAWGGRRCGGCGELL